jgi:hypothetical protein
MQKLAFFKINFPPQTLFFLILTNECYFLKLILINQIYIFEVQKTTHFYLPKTLLDSKATCNLQPFPKTQFNRLNGSLPTETKSM